MQTNLALIRENIAAAEQQLFALRAALPQEIPEFPEVEELDMGLEWVAKRIELIWARLDTNSSGPAGA